MKIIRHLTACGPAHAALQPDGTARAIVGDLLGAFHLGAAVAVIGKRLAPLVPTTIFGIGLNYRKHAEELGRPIPPYPLIFLKSGNTVQNPGDPIELPRALASHKVDYECELAVVIGKGGKNIPRERAHEHILGYTCANDVSARDWQFEWGASQFCQGKSFDTFCPLGPVLVTPDELPDLGPLAIKTLVNGELRQSGTLGDLIFDVPALIAFLSASKTLLPGTVILTGTPGGTGISLQPPVFLQPGDSVTVEIDHLGALTNPVIAELIV